MAIVALDGVITSISSLVVVGINAVGLDGTISSVSIFKAKRSVFWLSTLPRFPLLAGYTDGEANNVIRSQINISISKLRRRSGAGSSVVAFPVLLTNAQKINLENFYKVDLRDGIRVFVLELPGEQEISRLRFVVPPSYRAVTHDFWSTELQFEIVRSNDKIGIGLGAEEIESA